MTDLRCRKMGKVKLGIEKAMKLLNKALKSNFTNQVLFPILKGAAMELLQAITHKYLKEKNPAVAKIIATLLNPTSILKLFFAKKEINFLHRGFPKQFNFNSVRFLSCF